MTPRPHHLTLVVLLIVTVLGTAVPPASAGPAAGPAPGSAAQALAAQARRVPGGHVVGNRIYYPHGVVFVAEDAAALSVSQCESGEFCVWSYTGYTGSFIYKTGTDVTRAIETSVGSFYNNRARAARLYTNTGASSTCYDAQTKRAGVTASYGAAEKVYLSDTTSC
ncbi:MAG: hypothetical protein JWO76_3098 [Nocardioides sp.]|nr:hypothetical protein [Nocardioides sp.]